MVNAGLDAIVAGAGPNGLAAAIVLARAGRSVRVYEAAPTPGGGTRSAELTLPGFVHDVCSAAHPLGIASPFFRSIDLARHGLEWVQPDAPVAHALAPGRGVVLERSVDAMRESLGRDGAAWRRLFGPLVREHERLVAELMRPAVHVPRHPLLMARFGARALLPATALARLAFDEPAARALFTGMAGHSMLALGRVLSGAYGLVLGTLAQATGWPLARGGSGRVADTLVAEATALGVEIETDHVVRSLEELPRARDLLLDLTPRQVLAVGGDRLPARYRRALARFRYGPGVFKLDWALDGPVPWRDPALARAGTVHVGGTFGEVARSEAAVASGRHPDRPFVILVQPTLVDASRAPAGKHIAWAYCHVPSGSGADMTSAIETQVERFAPGFRDRVLARSAMNARAMEAYDANYVGGDINGGLGDWRQLVFRPVARRDPYATPVPGLWLCSSSTPPGGGVHGMCGSNAARRVLHRG